MTTRSLSLRLISENIYTSINGAKAKYDYRAKYYEWMVSTKVFNLLCWNTLPKFYSEFASKAILNRKGSILDIGCGGLSQTASLYLKTNNECILVDRSLGMLKVAEKRLNSSGIKFPSKIKIIQADAFNLPFEHKSFETVCSFGTIHLFDDKQRFVNEVIKYLKPNGHFYFLVMTNKYLNSNLFMNLLKLFGEFGKVCSENELLDLFPADKFNINSYMKGSVLFIEGETLF